MSLAPIVSRSAVEHLVFRPVLGSGSAAASVASQPWSIENRLSLSNQELAIACVLLDYARHHQHFAASPCRSRFKVGSSVYCGQDRIAQGSNAEYGAGPRRAYDEGVHSEEVAVVNALNHFGREVQVKMVALASDAVAPSTSCGKCRSLLETYGERNVVIVSAGEGTGVSMWTLSELLPGNFAALQGGLRVPEDSLQLRDLRHAAQKASQASFTPFSEQELGRSVSAIAIDGEVLSFPRVDSLAFYGTSSLRATISAALLKRPRRLEAVLVSSRTGFPTGEDRQLLFEFASLFSQADTLQVYLHVEGTDTAYMTNPAALLPHGFGPSDLAIDLSTR